MQTVNKATKYRKFQEMDIVDRLKIYMEHIGLQISQFADTAMIPRPTLSQILSGRNKKISNEILGKLHSAYPALNISWLLFGDEPMEYVANKPVVSAPIQSQVQHDPHLEPIHVEPDNEDSNANAAIGASAAPSPQATPAPISLTTDSSKRVQTIMVFYSDNSFETFTPAQR